jgi:hypothetical protein
MIIPHPDPIISEQEPITGTSAHSASNPLERSSTHGSRSSKTPENLTPSPTPGRWNTEDTSPDPIDNLYEDIAMTFISAIIAGIILAVLLAG